jgi:hypothetical protein
MEPDQPEEIPRRHPACTGELDKKMLMVTGPSISVLSLPCHVAVHDRAAQRPSCINGLGAGAPRIVGEAVVPASCESGLDDQPPVFPPRRLSALLGRRCRILSRCCGFCQGCEPLAVSG